MARKRDFSGAITTVSLTLWVGALWMTAITAYALFRYIPDHQLAGFVAGKLFTIVSMIGIVCGLWLLLQRLADDGLAVLKQSVFWVLLSMWALVLVGEFGIQPLLAQLKASALPNDVMQSVFASRFKTWHGVASIAYLMECLLGLWLIVKSV